MPPRSTLLLAPFLLVALACQTREPAQAEPTLARTDTSAPPPDSTAAPRTTARDSAALATDGGTIHLPLARQRILLREDSLWAEALRIHYNAIVLDGHIDTPSLMLDDGYNFGVRHRSTDAHLDLPRMYEGGLDAVFFSIYVAHFYGEGARATQRARAMLAEVERQVRLRPDSAEIATSAADVRRITRSGRKAILLGLESGHALAASPDTLRALYQAGIRYVTLTHNTTHSWADASQTAPRWGGLNDVGRSLVREMNRLGMLVDLAHVSDSTFFDALAVAEAPVLVSHSSARALVPSVRNVDDAMLRALARNGGVVMVNFFDPMVNAHLTESVMQEVHRRLPGPDLRLIWNVVYEIRRERGLPGATLDDVLDHIDHIARTAGVDHVGLGSDFDGVFDLPTGLQDVTRLPWITYGLLKRGYSEADLYKILGGNALRVLEEAERFAQTAHDR